jgi:hypothetical protein
VSKRDQQRRDLGPPSVTSEAVTRRFRYTNRKGQTYYLHVGKTKTGKRRYFVAKTVGDGVLDAVLAGFEIVESINGVVSVRRIDPDARRVPELDLACVRAELGRHRHLQRHRADAVKGEIRLNGGTVDAPVRTPPVRRRPHMRAGLRDSSESAADARR